MGKKNQNKKQLVVPKWAKIAICAVLLVAILGGIVAVSIMNSGIIYRNRILVESKSGKFDLNQQMAAFILWQSVYEQAYYEYMYTQYGIYTDTNKILDYYYSANDYAVLAATAYVRDSLNKGITSMNEYLTKMVASADAALAAGLKLESHDKEEAKSYVEYLESYHTQFKSEYAQTYYAYQETGLEVPTDALWTLRNELAMSSFAQFLNTAVGDTFKSSDIEAAAELMIMYAKYTDYISMEYEDDADIDTLQNFILKNPDGHFKTEYYKFTDDSDLAMIREFFSDKFMDERYKAIVTKYVANLDLNTSMLTGLSDDKVTEKLTELGMNNFTTYTKTVDADGNATYSPTLNDKLGESIFSTSIKAKQISAIADGDTVYLVYFKEASTSTSATISFKEYKYDDCTSKLPEIENLEGLIKECVKAGKNTTDYKTDDVKANKLLIQLKDNPTKGIPEEYAPETATSKKDSANDIPKAIHDKLYDSKTTIKDNGQWVEIITVANDPNTSYVVRVDSIEKVKDENGEVVKDENGNTTNTTDYNISYVKFEADPFTTLLAIAEEEFTLYLLDTTTDAPTYTWEGGFEEFKKEALNWVIDQSYETLVLSHYAKVDLNAIDAAKKDTDPSKLEQKLAEIFKDDSSIKCYVKNYALKDELDSSIYNFIVNADNQKKAQVFVDKDNHVYLVYVAPKAEGTDAHANCEHSSTASTVRVGIKEYKFTDYEEALKITTGTGDSAVTKTYREQIYADLLADDRKNTTNYVASEDKAAAEYAALTATSNKKAWPEGLETVKTYKPAKEGSSNALMKLNTAPDAIIEKIYPNGNSTTSLSVTKDTYYQVDDGEGNSYVFKVTALPAKNDADLTCQIQYQTFTDDHEYCHYFRVIKSNLDTAMPKDVSNLTYPESFDDSINEWIFKSEYKEATADTEATREFERKKNDLTIVATTSSNKVSNVTVYIVDKVAEQVKTEDVVVYGGYLSFATLKDAQKALKQLKDKTGFALLDKFVSLESVSTDANGQENVATPTVNFAIKKDSVTDSELQAWLFGNRKANDVEIITSKDGKSFYLAVYMSSEQTWLRTARTDWIDEQIVAHMDELVKNGDYKLNETEMAKIEDVVTTTTK